LYVLWQLCSGVDENAAGACAQLVFAPIDESFADDAPLLPSGFRVIPLDAKTVSRTGFLLVAFAFVMVYTNNG
jgi:homeobox-leucine zipper protein